MMVNGESAMGNGQSAMVDISGTIFILFTLFIKYRQLK